MFKELEQRNAFGDISIINVKLSFESKVTRIFYEKEFQHSIKKTSPLPFHVLLEKNVPHHNAPQIQITALKSSIRVT